MKLDVTQEIKQRNGDPMIDNDGTGKTVNANVRNALINALEASLKADQSDAPKKKYERSKLADKIYDNDTVELTSEEVTLIKERVGKVFGAYVVKYLWDLLEEKTG